jgi:16S rRNA (guanine527-N7)-methyltransferase
VLEAGHRDAQRRQLDAGLDTLGLDLAEDARRRLLDYLDLMLRWNRTQRLTAVTDPFQMVARHLFDSLSILPWVDGARLADIGSGAGLPGIPLAIAAPGREVVLLDSQAKRCRFLFQARVELGLDNVEVVHARVEEYRTEAGFDCVVSRAFATLRDFVTASVHLCAPAGRLLAMKGRDPAAEIAALQMPYNVELCVPLAVPGLDAERHLVVINSKPGDRSL